MTYDRVVVLDTRERHWVLDLIVAQWVSDHPPGTRLPNGSISGLLRDASIMDLIEWHYRKLQKEQGET